MKPDPQLRYFVQNCRPGHERYDRREEDVGGYDGVGAYSPALCLIRMVWDRNREGTGWSWQRLNQSMRAAVHLTIQAGMRFELGDFCYMDKKLSLGRWGVVDNSLNWGETFY